ncbi:MAG: hypothetical protein AW07_03932 [Candidatus Accumulibacter sp. SK-11]|nr:MAG: hypothetical protein AW07_03932 [Candidatus Accumulibacter sp. SK-11]HCV13085.1 hypothetical protein [Accumulibacter sp.]
MTCAGLPQAASGGHRGVGLRRVGVLALALPAADGRAVDAGRGQAVAAPRSTGAQPLLVSGEQRKTLFDVIV